MLEALVNCLGGLSLSRKSVVRLIDHPGMTIDVYHGHKTTTQLCTCCSQLNTNLVLKYEFQLKIQNADLSGILSEANVT